MVNDWPLVPIGQFLDFKNGLNKGKAFFGYGTPIVNYTDVYHHSGLHSGDIQGKVSLSSDEIKRFEVKKGDVFFTRTSETPEEVGLSAVLLDDIEDCAFSGFVLRGRPKNEMLLPEYCQYCFSTKAVRQAIISNCTYTTRALTNGRVLSAIEIPVPPKKEQKAIADALSEMEEYISSLKQLIEKKRAIRDGVTTEVVMGKTTIDGHDCRWTQVELNKLASFRKDRTHSQRRHYISTENMKQMFAGVTSYEGTEQVDGIAFYSGDTLIANIRPYLKKVWSADFCGCCSADVLALVGNDRIVPKFLYYCIANDQFINYVMKGGVKGIKMPRGDKKYIMQYPVRLPIDLNEQQMIADALTSMDEEIKALDAEHEKMIQIREGAMDDLLTGRVRLSV